MTPTRTRTRAGFPDGPLDPHLFGENQPCFGCSPAHPIGFHLRFEREGDAVVTRFVPSDAYQGPPGIMHGGLVATLADEIAAWAIVGLLGKFGFTAQFEGKLRAPVRIGVEVIGRGRIVRDGARLVGVGVELLQRDARVFQGDFTFVLLDEQGAERLLEGQLPEAWRKFAR
jgi:acyl-coenzyme A thioesterase PaaI-like protein